MTALFVTVDQVATRMQVQSDLEGVADVIESSLKGAQLHIESVLNTDLELRAQDCTFLLDSDAFSGIQPNGQFKIELPSYFLRPNSLTYPLAITVGDNWRVSDPEAIDLSLCRIDYEKGLIYIDAETYKDKYVRVTGTTGFKPADPGPSPPEAVAEAIPDWLHEAILSYVGVIMDTSQTTKRAPDAKEIYQRAGDHAMAVLNPKMRKRGFAIRPFNQ